MTRFASRARGVCPADARRRQRREPASQEHSRRRASSTRRCSPAPAPSRSRPAALAPPHASSSGPSTACPRRRSITAVGGVCRAVLRHGSAARSRIVPGCGARLAGAPAGGRRHSASIAPVRGTLRADGDRRSAPRWVGEQLGVTGTGVGVATIDSGVSAWHADLDGRVVHFADFVSRQSSPYDDYGHGTHVAGIIAGSGRDVERRAPRLAPGAHLVVLKALDVIAAPASRAMSSPRSTTRSSTARAFNIRVLNLSVAAGVYESYTQGPADARRQARRRRRHRRRRRRRQPRPRRVRAAAVRRHHFAGQRALGADCRRDQRARHAVARRRRRRGVQLTRTIRARPRQCQARPRRARRRHRVDGRAVERALRPPTPTRGCGERGRARSEPYLSLTGTSMAAPVVTGSRRADARGQPRADAERRQGDPAIHRRGARRRTTI